MSKASDAARERADAVVRLKEWLKPGDTVFTVLRHVSRSGMMREISLHYIDKETASPQWISGVAARAMGDRLGKRDGIIVGGCGMDMGFHLVYNLSRTLWPNGAPCVGTKEDRRCRSNDHVNSGPQRDLYGPDIIHRDGGYALNQRWL